MSVGVQQYILTLEGRNAYLNARLCKLNREICELRERNAELTKEPTEVEENTHVVDTKGALAAFEAKFTAEPEVVNSAASMSLAEIGLSVQICNLLSDYNVHAVADLIQYSPYTLIRRFHWGKRRMDQIKEALAEYGLKLADEKPGAEDPTLSIGIDGIGLRAKTVRVLKCGGFNTIADVVAKSPSELLSVRNFGESMLNELVVALAREGQELNEELTLTKQRRAERILRPARKALTGVEVLNLSPHVKRVLDEARIATLDDLSRYYRGCGNTKIDDFDWKEIENTMRALGFEL